MVELATLTQGNRLPTELSRPVVLLSPEHGMSYGGFQLGNFFGELLQGKRLNDVCRVIGQHRDRN